MELETIEELAGILSASSLSRLEIESSGASLQMERAVAPMSPPAAPEAAPAQDVFAASEAVPAKPPGVPVEAPIVGVFHEATPAIVNGQEVRAGDILGAIEALALRNEIRAPVDGVVVSVHVEDGQPVEYGQAMFTIGRPEEGA